MRTLIFILQNKLTEAIKKFCEEQDFSDFDKIAEIAYCNDQRFGNYQCNDALKLAKLLKKNPREVAGEIISKVEKEDVISKMEIAGPGFINMVINPKFLSDQLNEAEKDSHLGVELPKKQRIIVEFSSPNVAKQLHVGHLRSTIIGDCLARLFEFLGNDVLRLNHIGDWGTQFGMLIAYMKEYATDVLEGKKETDLTGLETWYKQAKQKFDADEDFKKRAHMEVVNLQSGEKEAFNVWQIICNISRKAYQEIYDLLDIKIKERGESYYNPVLKDVVEELDQKGLVEVSDGAKCIFLEGFKIPLMVQKSDGGFNYDTTDMAAIKQRVFEEKSDRIIVVTDVGQSLHFQLIHAAAIKAGYIDPLKTEFNHVTFGLVLGPDGKKFKTRSGETEKLIDLLTGAVDRARELIKERDPQMDEKELNKLAIILGIGAIKYADLSCHRQKDYRFSYERMLRFEGNTAVFLLYSYVRIMGIKRKISNADEIIKKASIDLQHPSEIALGIHLRRFGEILNGFAKDLLPNRLTDYLYELAEKFNAFFRDCKVAGDEMQNQRLVLCDLTAKILKAGLTILGIQTTDRL